MDGCEEKALGLGHAPKHRHQRIPGSSPVPQNNSGSPSVASATVDKAALTNYHQHTFGQAEGHQLLPLVAQCPLTPRIVFTPHSDSAPSDHVQGPTTRPHSRVLLNAMTTKHQQKHHKAIHNSVVSGQKSPQSPNPNRSPHTRPAQAASPVENTGTNNNMSIWQCKFCMKSPFSSKQVFLGLCCVAHSPIPFISCQPLVCYYQGVPLVLGGITTLGACVATLVHLTGAILLNTRATAVICIVIS